MIIWDSKALLLGKRNILLLMIPLSLSSFTHLLNSPGFPDIFYDEGVYMRRAMHVLEGLGPQEGTFYDHPYFGQLFLAAVMALVGYPQSINPSSSAESIAALYAVPRVLMGILAVVDTFLVYMIAGTRYGKRVALISSVLFAVMPITWILRRILLDSILLPFLLTSVLFAMQARNSEGRRKTTLILFSGIFLGVAIFTKIPIFTMIPLVGYLIYSAYTKSQSRAKMLGIWAVPLILIPMVWPAYSIAVGQFHLWLDDAIGQTQRQSAGFGHIAEIFFLYDPILLLLGTAGIIYAILTRDYLGILWIGPFVIFMSLIGYVQYFYWIPVLPIFCIAAARLVDRLSFKRKQLPFATVVAVSIFGLVSTTLLVTANLTSAQFAAAAFASNIEDNGTTLVASPVYSWIFMYVFHKEHTFGDYRDLLYYPIQTKKILLISDQHFQYNINAGKQLRDAYNNTKAIAVFKGNVLKYDLELYPYTNMAANYEGSVVEVRISK